MQGYRQALNVLRRQENIRQDNLCRQFCEKKEKKRKKALDSMNLKAFLIQSILP